MGTGPVSAKKRPRRATSTSRQIHWPHICLRYPRGLYKTTLAAWLGGARRTGLAPSVTQAAVDAFGRGSMAISPLLPLSHDDRAGQEMRRNRMRQCKDRRALVRSLDGKQTSLTPPQSPKVGTFTQHRRPVSTVAGPQIWPARNPRLALMAAAQEEAGRESCGKRAQ